MKKMFICGDSYMSPSILKPNTHFSELLSNKIDYELVSLARGGMSNLGICLQIEYAIKEKPDLILLNTTSYDRIEIPIKSKSDYGFSLEDVIYIEYTSSSTYSALGNNEPNLICDTLYALQSSDDYWLKKYSDKIPNMEYIKPTVKDYFQNMYNHVWKSQTDKWALYAALHKLELSKIPYILVLSTTDIKSSFNWLNDTNCILENFMIETENVTGVNDPGYHTSEETQIFICNTIYEHLKVNNFLKS